MAKHEKHYIVIPSLFHTFSRPGSCQLILRKTLNLSLVKLNLMCEVLVKHCQSISRIECSLDPLGSITAAEVLWHQCDRINTSKAESGPTAASHSQYSTFHVLLRFTTISRKPTASQTEKDNGANLLLSDFPSASVKYVKFCV